MGSTDNAKIKERIIEILNRIFSDAGIDKDILEYVDLIDDLNMDSIVFVSLIIELETEFCVQIPDEWMMLDKFHNCTQITNTILSIYHEYTEDTNVCQ